jgi:hypothetical protein
MSTSGLSVGRNLLNECALVVVRLFFLPALCGHCFDFQLEYSKRVSLSYPCEKASQLLSESLRGLT